MRRILVASVLMVAAVGCQNKKKTPPPDTLNQPAAQPPVAYVPPSNGQAGATDVATTPPADVAAPVDTTPADVTPAAPAKKTKTSAHTTGHISGHTYVIKKGDTLYSISRARYGTNARVKDIEAANPGIDPTKLQVGQKIKLP